MLSPGLYNYWIVVVLMMAGFYTLISRGNLVKKLIGLNIFQVSVFMLYISMGKVQGGVAPILIGEMPAHGHAATHAAHDIDSSHDLHHDVHAKESPPRHPNESEGVLSDVLPQIDASPSLSPAAVQLAELQRTGDATIVYSNPLPHVLILTAIVVGVATTALGLALVVRINEQYGTIEEDEIHVMDPEQP